MTTHTAFSDRLPNDPALMVYEFEQELGRTRRHLEWMKRFTVSMERRQDVEPAWWLHPDWFDMCREDLERRKKELYARFVEMVGRIREDSTGAEVYTVVAISERTWEILAGEYVSDILSTDANSGFVLFAQSVPGYGQVMMSWRTRDWLRAGGWNEGRTR